MAICLNCFADVDLYRKRLPFVCGCGGVFRADGRFRMPRPDAVTPREHDACGNLVALTAEQIADKARMNKLRREAAGRKAWGALHGYRGDDPEGFLRTVFEMLIPSYGCSCRKDYRKRIADHPPDFSSPDAFFVWGVDLHNWVNAKLIDEGDTTKRIVPIDEARAIWNRPAA